MDYKEYDGKRKKLSRSEACLMGIRSRYKPLTVMGLLLSVSLTGILTFRFSLINYSGEMAMAVEAGEVTSSQAMASVSSFTNMFYIACFLLVIPASLVMAGIMKAVRSIAWREKGSLRDFFGEGIKENGLFTLTVFIFNVAVLWCVSFVTRSAGESPMWRYLPTAGYILVILPWSVWFLCATAIYRGGLILTAKNAFSLLVRTYPATLVTVFAAAAPLLLMLLPNIWLQLAVPFLFAVYLPFAWLCLVHFTNSVFDKYVNPVSFPELVGRGLE